MALQPSLTPNPGPMAFPNLLSCPISLPKPLTLVPDLGDAEPQSKEDSIMIILSQELYTWVPSKQHSYYKGDMTFIIMAKCRVPLSKN